MNFALCCEVRAHAHKSAITYACAKEVTRMPDPFSVQVYNDI